MTKKELGMNIKVKDLEATLQKLREKGYEPYLKGGRGSVKIGIDE